MAAKSKGNSKPGRKTKRNEVTEAKILAVDRLVPKTRPLRADQHGRRTGSGTLPTKVRFHDPTGCGACISRAVIHEVASTSKDATISPSSDAGRVGWPAL